MCFGCMTSVANVKLIKNCINSESSNDEVNGVSLQKCVSCECKPLWCVDCMGKWYVFINESEFFSGGMSKVCTLGLS